MFPLLGYYSFEFKNWFHDEEIGTDGLLKNSHSVIPECLIGNPVYKKATASGFPLPRE